jgi:hypothetical protein
MNYAAVILVGITVFAVIWWYVSGRHFYIGPRVKATVNMSARQQLRKDALEEKLLEEKDR